MLLPALLNEIMDTPAENESKKLVQVASILHDQGWIDIFTYARVKQLINLGAPESAVFFMRPKNRLFSIGSRVQVGGFVGITDNSGVSYDGATPALALAAAFVAAYWNKGLYTPEELHQIKAQRIEANKLAREAVERRGIQMDPKLREIREKATREALEKLDGHKGVIAAIPDDQVEERLGHTGPEGIGRADQGC